MPTVTLCAGEPLFVPHGAGEMGVGFASVAYQGHWSCFYNQALLTDRTGFSASFALESRFMMTAMSSKAISIIMAGRTVPLAAVVSHYGNGDYYRIFTGIGSAVNLTKDISVGVQADYLLERSAGDYRDLSHVTFETGMLVGLSSSVTFGFHIFNPLAPLNSLPSSVTAGIGWKPSGDVCLVMEGNKVTDEPLSVQGGISWRLLDRLTLRAGYISSPSCFTFGLGYLAGTLQTDAAFMLNGTTGVTSSVSLIWSIKRK